MSSKAKRLKRIKPGFFNPPGERPIFVPGYKWLQVIVLGLQAAPTLAHFRWWTTRGEMASDKRSQETEVLREITRRWQIEMSIRFDKGELAFEGPRLRRWETQLRLLLFATLAYSFLLSLLNPDPVDTLAWLLRHWCHRTREWSRKVQAPLSRLRSAISRFWLSHPPPFLLLLRLNSGRVMS